MNRESRLELAFLASGATQHVFLRADSPGNGWVYKIPAVYDELLPDRFRLRGLKPVGWKGRAAYRILYSVPRNVASGVLATGRGSLGRSARAASEVLGRGYLRVMDRLVRAHLRRARRSGFERMLRTLDGLSRRGLDDVVLPFRSHRHSHAVLHLPSGSRLYRGPLLQQRRADHFFARADHLEAIEPQALIRIQHRLWRHGLALGDAAGALGPNGWALLDGDLYLADTGSLTTDRALAERIVSTAMERVHDNRIRRVTRAGGDVAAVGSYDSEVLGEINEYRLAKLWRTAPARGATVVGDGEGRSGV